MLKRRESLMSLAKTLAHNQDDIYIYSMAELITAYTATDDEDPHELVDALFSELSES